jgi:hypothetical protein
MSDTSVLTTLVVYRIVTLLVGFGSIVLGYRLFCRGLYDQGGDLQVKAGDTGLVLQKVGPGIFFALFGTAVIIASVWNAPSFTREVIDQDNQKTLLRVAMLDRPGTSGSPSGGGPGIPIPPSPGGQVGGPFGVGVDVEQELRRLQAQLVQITARKQELQKLLADRQEVNGIMKKVFEGKALDKAEIERLKAWAANHWGIGNLPTRDDVP